MFQESVTKNGLNCNVLYNYLHIHVCSVLYRSIIVYERIVPITLAHEPLNNRTYTATCAE